ncbi:RpnC/YadD family protein [Streptomyces reniochalinae]|uniref:Rpn family recombination-promoting nuclease/putative transposase n=1 Tax=Streptomyces reniochalinae TaxID=2250578 RepID=A0A367EP58_9ACTN|nr:hypothetical protein [Streptomyces reniochalinae]RCG19395.1 hypothetical protein DQ392_12160 [Streptomyces reniochalinae]
MVTSRHETAHRIFQERPALLVPTFRLLGVSLPEDSLVEVLTPDATELKPIERRLDSVLRLTPRDGGPPVMLAVEAQSRRDQGKAASWAYYLSFLTAQNNCASLLVVVCQDKDTAEWAAGPFHLGPDDWKPLTVRPLVLGPGNVPMIVDPEEAAEDLAMATFAAMTHSKSPDITVILDALARALGTADSESLNYYSELMESGLGNTPARQTWRKLMKNGSYFPGRGTLVEETFLKGKAEGQAEGMAEGKAAGQAEGQVRSVLRLLEMRGIPVTETQRARLAACTDPEVLDTWLERAFRITDADQLFADEPGAAAGA